MIEKMKLYGYEHTPSELLKINKNKSVLGPGSQPPAATPNANMLQVPGRPPPSHNKVPAPVPSAGPSGPGAKLDGYGKLVANARAGA